MSFTAMPVSADSFYPSRNSLRSGSVCHDGHSRDIKEGISLSLHSLRLLSRYGGFVIIISFVTIIAIVFFFSLLTVFQLLVSLPSYFLSSFALMFRFFHHYFQLFFIHAMLASLAGCFQTWLIRNALTMKLSLLVVSCLLFAAVHSAAVDLDSVHITDAEVRI